MRIVLGMIGFLAVAIDLDPMIDAAVAYLNRSQTQQGSAAAWEVGHDQRH